MKLYEAELTQKDKQLSVSQAECQSTQKNIDKVNELREKLEQ